MSVIPTTAAAAAPETANPFAALSDEELQRALSQHSFYHEIEVRPGVKTKPKVNFQRHWDFITKELSVTDFTGKRVLDVGCRDGLFSLLAEKRGASFVKGIDNDMSSGSVKVVLPALGSRVVMEEENLLHFVDEPYDIVMCFGVLYHLRYPMAGLSSLLHLVRPGGSLLIETACLHRLGSGPGVAVSEVPLLYCPFTPNPYEPTSVSYFNRAGLTHTLNSLGAIVNGFNWGPAELVNSVTHYASNGSEPSSEQPGQWAQVRRAFAHCVKLSDAGALDHLRRYWSGTHNSHSR